MRLRDVAKYFDTTVAQCVGTSYSTVPSQCGSFKCQIEPLDMYRVDGTRIKIRNMSTAPDVVIPDSREIFIEGQHYLVSDPSYDYWGSEIIRTRYILQGTREFVCTFSLADLLRMNPSTWGSMDMAMSARGMGFVAIEFNKYSTDDRDSSEYHSMFHIFNGQRSDGHVVAGLLREGDIIIPARPIGGQCAVELNYHNGPYFAKAAYKAPSGVHTALCRQLSNKSIGRVDLIRRVYNPVDDSYAEDVTSHLALVLRWQDFFEYKSVGDIDFERTDQQVVLSEDVEVANGAQVVVNTGTPQSGSTRVFTVLSVVHHSGYKVLHVRRSHDTD